MKSLGAVLRWGARRCRTSCPASSFAGFAFAPVAGVILFTAFAPGTAVPVLIVCSIIVQAATLARLRGSVPCGRIGPMLAGGALGVPLAVLLLHRIDAAMLQTGFGLLLAGYALVMLAGPCARVAIADDSRREAAIGFAGGLVGGLTAMPGAVPVLYCDIRGIGKEAQRAIVRPFILAMQVLALAVMAVHGDLGRTTAALVAWSLPALALGTALGLALFGRASAAAFRRAVLILLLATGLALALKQAVPSATLALAGLLG